MSIEFKLGDFLGRGSIIRTKHSEDPSWVTNMVYGINDESIEIDLGLEKNYIDNILMVGDTMKCKFTTEEYEYNIVGWVSKINMDFPQSITIRVHEVGRFENLRDSYRYDVYLSSVVKLDKHESKGIFAILTNISQTGAAFIVREELGTLLNFDETCWMGTKVIIEAYISPDRRIEFEAEMVRKSNKDKGIEYGVRVFEIDINNQKILVDFLNELALRDKEFYNKRSSFWAKNSKFN